MPPKFNRRRAVFVLGKIDEILAWEQRKETERDTKFVELGRFLCEVRAGQYWRLESLKCFDEFLQRRFPESRRKAYYLMSIHENLPPQARRQLKEVGWAKGIELVKLARRDRQNFDCATWLHKARQMPKEDFKKEVERELTGRETEPWEIVYFKVYESQIPVVEKAIETAALMLGTDRSRGYCLDFDDEILQIFARRAEAGISRRCDREGVMSSNRPRVPPLRLDAASYVRLRQQVLCREGWRCQSCGTMSKLEVHHEKFRSRLGDDSQPNLITLCSFCYAAKHRG